MCVCVCVCVCVNARLKIRGTGCRRRFTSAHLTNPYMHTESLERIRIHISQVYKYVRSFSLSLFDVRGPHS